MPTAAAMCIAVGNTSFDDWPRFPALATQQLAGAVGDHLVEVHVGLGAGARLPHHQRELAVVPAGEDLVGRGDDGLRLVGRQLAQVAVHLGRGALDLRQRLDQLLRLALAGDAEVLQRALRLRAPQGLGRHFDRPEGVAFDAVFAHVVLRCGW
jgi:hypothetical protein